jgi:cytochrome c peroxidase
MHFRWGKRRPQSYTYSPYFPGLQYNRVLKVFLGGNFWDSRSTGYKLSSPDAEQAQHPPVDPNEHGFPDTACIAYRLCFHHVVHCDSWLRDAQADGLDKVGRQSDH